jgi:hypothetical protein
MKLSLDLHIHSQASPDGRMTLEEITSQAKAKGLDGVAICDHDGVYHGPSQLNGVLIIPGAEFSTEYGHLLGLFLDRNVTHTVFPETVEAIHAAGGLAVLAHPFQRRTDSSAIDPLAPLLDGVEVWNGRADRKNPQANAQARDFAQRHHLAPFAGSDAHLPREIGNGVTTVEVEERSLEAVRAALAAGKGTCTGTRGKDWDVARSQHTKLQKGEASLARWVRWAAFACKCAGSDLKKGR